MSLEHAGKRDEVGNLPAVERQLRNSLVFDDRSDARGSRLDLSGVRLNFDLFAYLTDSRNRIDHSVAVDLQHHSDLKERTETP